MLYTTPIKINGEPEYTGVIAIRYHDEFYRIYKQQVVYAEFYDIEAGKQYLKELQYGKSNRITSTD